MNLIRIFKQEIIAYLSRSTSNNDSLIKFEINGSHDFGFCVNLQIWKNYFELSEDPADYKNNILIYAACKKDVDEDCAINSLIKASEKWTFRIEKAWIEKGICCINLNRFETFKRILQLISSDEYPSYEKIEGKTISIKTDKVLNSSITQFRLEVIEKALRNFISFSPYTLDDTNANINLLLTTRSHLKGDDTNRELIPIVCAVVCDKDEGKKTSRMEAQNYLEKRQNDMHLIAIHKFGVRVKNDKEFVELTKKLGNAAATLDMIEVKHSSALRLNSNPKQAFILYNSARIETLISTFEEMVQQNYYPALLHLNDVNLELLVEPLEWELLKHLLAFTDVIEKSLGDIANGQIALHVLYKYLIGIANTFSVYYSKKKILLENRPHLVKIVHAKIHLLKALQKTFNMTLNLFDIEPVKFM